MTPDQSELMEKATRSLEAARPLLDEEHPDFAASRAYYAMFYAAEAMLEGEELAFSSHAAVVAAFGREFARTGRVPSRLHQYLTRAMNLRHARLRIARRRDEGRRGRAGAAGGRIRRDGTEEDRGNGRGHRLNPLLSIRG